MEIKCPKQVISIMLIGILTILAGISTEIHADAAETTVKEYTNTNLPETTEDSVDTNLFSESMDMDVEGEESLNEVENSDMADDPGIFVETNETIYVGSLELQYDDRFLLEDYDSFNLTGYSIQEITSFAAGSDDAIVYRASDGEKEESTAVLMQDSENELVATEVGTALVTLYNESKDETIALDVTVEPAPLTLMFLAGQSNMEGSSSSATGSHPEDSVMCPDGEVYSTYAPSSDTRGQNNTGLSAMTSCTKNNADSFVAASLTGTISRAGTELVYPMDALTSSGGGKTGPDSGLAYEWNRLTGDKVWVVNAAWAGTSITGWIPGGSYYERALAVYQAALETVQEEVAAGHYTLEHTLLFWLQGESDNTMSTEDYISNYELMFNGFASNGLGIEYQGIIVCRASKGAYTTSEDLYMTGPRIAQYLLGNSIAYPNIYMVSNVNEQWVTDSGVEEYFKSEYGTKLSYPLRSNTTLSGLPTTVKNIHSDIHYSQVGHNENGISAARNMYYVIYGGGKSSSDILWYDQEGNALSSGERLALSTGSESLYVPVADLLYLSKEMTVSVDGSNFSYDMASGKLKTTDTGSGKLKATIGSTSSSITISTEIPALKSATANAGGIKLSWSSVSGASGYSVHRKEAGGSWSRIGTTTSTSYTDKTSLTNGKTYYYTVRAYWGSESKALANTYSSEYWSSYDSVGREIIYTKTPTLSGVSNTSTGLKVSWSSVSGAKGYSVHRKTSGGSWSMIGTTTSASYTDTTAKSGATYYYTVRAYRASSEVALENTYDAKHWSGYDSVGVSLKYLAAPTLKSAEAASGGTKISWSSVSGASGYSVHRKEAGGSWSRIGTTTGTSYTDKTALKNGKTYYYTVRAYTGTKSKALANTYSSTYWSSYDSSGLSIVYTKTPVLKSASNVAKGVKVSWSSVSGATGYAVHRKTAGGSWSRIGTTTGTSYTDTTAKSGTEYYYTVRAYRGDEATALANTFNAKYWSGYDSSGITGGRNK